MFTDLFGRSPQVRLLDFLADHFEYDYTITQMREYTRISRPTLYRLLQNLEDAGIVARTRTVGTSRFYKLNMDNPRVVALMQLDFEAVNRWVERTYPKAFARTPRKRKATGRRRRPLSATTG